MSSLPSDLLPRLAALVRRHRLTRQAAGRAERLLRRQVVAPLVRSSAVQDAALRLAGETVGLGRVPHPLVTQAQASQSGWRTIRQRFPLIPPVEFWPVVLVLLEAGSPEDQSETIQSIALTQAQMGCFRPVFLSVGQRLPESSGYPVELVASSADLPRRIIAMTDTYPIWLVLHATAAGFQEQDAQVLHALPEYLNDQSQLRAAGRMDP